MTEVAKHQSTPQPTLQSSSDGGGAIGEKKRRKPKKNAQEFWSTLSNDDGYLESVAGSTCSCHISLVRIEVAKENAVESGLGRESAEREGSEVPDHLSDLLAHLADVEKRGIDILNSREDLMELAAFSNPSSPPPELERDPQSMGSMDFIPPTSDLDTKVLMQTISDYKAKRGVQVGSPPAQATPPQLLSPKIVRLGKPVANIKDEGTATDIDQLMSALSELSANNKEKE